MDKAQTVSIVVPVYNGEKYLRPCLLSLQEQTYTAVEIIVVDDGSTDGSLAICEEFASQDERFHVIHCPTNQGVSYARNLGIESAQGEYIMFVDADDWVDVAVCQKCVEKMEEHRCGAVFFHMYYEYQNGHDRIPFFSRNKLLSQAEIVPLAARLINTYEKKYISTELYGPYCKLYRRSYISSIRFPPSLKYGEDTLYNLEALLSLRSIFLLDDTLYYRRMRKISASAGFKHDRLEQTALKLTYTQQLIEPYKAQYPILGQRLALFEQNILLFLLYYFARTAQNPLRDSIASVKAFLSEEPMKTILARADYRHNKHGKLSGWLLQHGLVGPAVVGARLWFYAKQLVKSVLKPLLAHIRPNLARYGERWE